MSYQKILQMSMAVTVLSSDPIFAQTGSPKGEAGQDRQDMRQDRQDPCVPSI